LFIGLLSSKPTGECDFLHTSSIDILIKNR